MTGQHVTDADNLHFHVFLSDKSLYHPALSFPDRLCPVLRPGRLIQRCLFQPATMVEKNMIAIKTTTEKMVKFFLLKVNRGLYFYREPKCGSSGIGSEKDRLVFFDVGLKLVLFFILVISEF